MALTDAEKQELLNEIKASSNDVSELETVDSLDGIVSLPAMKGEELVNAPVALLRKPAEEAAKTANAAATTANKAASTAEGAAQPIVLLSWPPVRLMRQVPQLVKQTR
mgnify:CR=1 FL=1